MTRLWKAARRLALLLAESAGNWERFAQHSEALGALETAAHAREISRRCSALTRRIQIRWAVEVCAIIDHAATPGHAERSGLAFNMHAMLTSRGVTDSEASIMAARAILPQYFDTFHPEDWNLLPPPERLRYCSVTNRQALPHSRPTAMAFPKPIHIKAQNKGKLHRALGVPEGEKIPASKIAAAKKSPSPAIRKEATFAQNATRWQRH